VIVDGGSSDGTLDEIARRQTPSMVLRSGPDRGIYDALNKGIALSTGEVIGIVHSDDILAHPGVVDQVARCFAKPEVDAVFGDLDYVAKDNLDRVIRRWRSSGYTPAKLAWGWMPPHPTLFVRRRVIEEFGAYDTSFQIAADYDAILRWFGKGRIRAVHLPEVLVKMRVGGESNRSLGRIIRKSREDYRALRSNRAGGLMALTAKNLMKLPQFLGR